MCYNINVSKKLTKGDIYMKYYNVDRSLWKEVAEKVLKSNKEIYEELRDELELEDVNELTKEEIIEFILEDNKVVEEILSEVDFDYYYNFAEDNTAELNSWYNKARA